MTYQKPQKVLPEGSTVVLQKFPAYFLLFCIFVSFWMLLGIISPFLTVLVLAAIFATTFYPLYSRILSYVGQRATIASFLTCLIVVFLIILPLSFFLVLLSREAVDLYHLLQAKVLNGEFDQYLKWENGNFLYDFYTANIQPLNAFVDNESVDLKKNVMDFARTLSAFLVGQSASLLKVLGGTFLNFFIMLIGMYYLMKNGGQVTQKLIKLSPFPLKHDLEIFRKFREMSKATVYGVFLVSGIKGILGGIGFLIAGIPNAIFWGTTMAIFSLLPLIGATLIWFPAALLLMMNGQMVAGIFLLLWGTLLVSTIDNIFQAFFIGSQANLNPFLVFLSVLGGIAVFNLLGVIFGPLILAIFFTFLHIYELEYKDLLKK